MSKENENLNEVENSALNIADVSVSVGCAYCVTPHLRYAEKYIQIDERTAKWELRLQQMWQGSDGSQKWEWVEMAE